MRQPERGGPTNDAGKAFWRFSLALYARPRVAEALIALQDRAGRDVNLMLFSLWAGAVRRVALDAGALAAAEAAIGGLRRDVVESLRVLRQRLKTDWNLVFKSPAHERSTLGSGSAGEGGSPMSLTRRAGSVRYALKSRATTS